MKNTFLILSMFYISAFLAQTGFNGKFINQDDYIFFHNNQADFLIQSNGCLTVPLKGKGSYQIMDDFLVIKTGNTKEFPKIKTLKNTDEYLKFEILSVNKPAIVTLEFLDEKGKPIKIVSTDKQGKVWVKNDTTYTKLRISSFNGNVFEIPVQNSLTYQIILPEYKVLSGKTLVFKIKSQSDTNLNLLLLSTDYTGKIKPKSLHRLYRKVIKNKINELVPQRLFIKEK